MLYYTYIILYTIYIILIYYIIYYIYYILLYIYYICISSCIQNIYSEMKTISVRAGVRCPWMRLLAARLGVIGRALVVPH